MPNHRFQVQIAFDCVSEDESTLTLSRRLEALLTEFAKDKPFFLHRLSIEQYRDMLTGKALELNADGTPYEDPYEIKNIPTDVL